MPEDDYLLGLLKEDSSREITLDSLVENLHKARQNTVNKFLSHEGSEDFIHALYKLIGHEEARVGGNAAYVIGTLAEDERGSSRIVSSIEDATRDQEKSFILVDLNSLLCSNDDESVMNAAGTVGTLCEDAGGRDYILRHKESLDELLEIVVRLLGSNNLWIASNCALILARLTIAENGVKSILEHATGARLLTKLVQCLGVDEAGRGMNAAFALGRICDTDDGRKKIVGMPAFESMASALFKMITSAAEPGAAVGGGSGASKNACFALSCVAAGERGHARLLANKRWEELIETLARLVGKFAVGSADAHETAWFAAMLLKTFALQPDGLVKIRCRRKIEVTLKNVFNDSSTGDDVREEVGSILAVMKRFDRPEAPPKLEEASGTSVRLSWPPATHPTNFPITFHLIQEIGDMVSAASGGKKSDKIANEPKPVYEGSTPGVTLDGLVPFTVYSFKYRILLSNVEMSPFSDWLVMKTDEALPGPPENLRTLALTPTQIKICWEPPSMPNGVVKGYHVYKDGQQVKFATGELVAIFSGLTPSTSYTIEVSAVNATGRGERAQLVVDTESAGMITPGAPCCTTLGHQDVQVQWDPPAMGKVTRYELIAWARGVTADALAVDGTITKELEPPTSHSMVCDLTPRNGFSDLIGGGKRVVWTGTGTDCTVKGLMADTDYVFVVVALTPSGRLESAEGYVHTQVDTYAEEARKASRTRRSPSPRPVTPAERPPSAVKAPPVTKRRASIASSTASGASGHGQKTGRTQRRRGSKPSASTALRPANTEPQPSPQPPRRSKTIVQKEPTATLRYNTSSVRREKTMPVSKPVEPLPERTRLMKIQHHTAQLTVQYQMSSCTIGGSAAPPATSSSQLDELLLTADADWLQYVKRYAYASSAFNQLRRSASGKGHTPLAALCKPNSSASAPPPPLISQSARGAVIDVPIGVQTFRDGSLTASASTRQSEILGATVLRNVESTIDKSPAVESRPSSRLQSPRRGRSAGSRRTTPPVGAQGVAALPPDQRQAYDASLERSFALSQPEQWMSRASAAAKANSSLTDVTPIVTGHHSFPISQPLRISRPPEVAHHIAKRSPQPSLRPNYPRALLRSADEGMTLEVLDPQVGGHRYRAAVPVVNRRQLVLKKY